MSSPDMVLLSIMSISRPHLGQSVSDGGRAGLRLYRRLIQDGSFIGTSFEAGIKDAPLPLIAARSGSSPIPAAASAAIRAAPRQANSAPRRRHWRRRRRPE